MVRAGHALYGYVSPARGEAPGQLLEVKPALTWKAKPLAVKDVPEGALIGYGGTFREPRPMRIGILGAGYADGRPTSILGTISMDLTTISTGATPRPWLRAMKRPCLEQKATRAWMRSRSPKWRAPSPTTFFAASARGCGGCTCEVGQTIGFCVCQQPRFGKE